MMSSAFLNEDSPLFGRKDFIAGVTALCISQMLAIPGESVANGPQPQEPLTIQQVIDLILKSVPGAPFQGSVDTLKAGKGSDKVRGIVTTMFATNEVIEKTAAIGANFIIAHEPTFYNHLDDTTWLENDTVYQFKKELLNKHGIAVWRFHDYIHAHRPDGVLMGVLTAMGWNKFYDKDKPNVVNIPPATLQNIIDRSKNQFGISHVRFIGTPSHQCRRVLLLPGAYGGRRQIQAIAAEQPDLLICGEVDEWETSEYVRDLRFMGKATALLVLGHIVSEEPGLEWLAQWLRPQVPGIKVIHIPSGDAFTWA